MFWVKLYWNHIFWIHFTTFLNNVVVFVVDLNLFVTDSVILFIVVVDFIIIFRNIRYHVYFISYSHIKCNHDSDWYGLIYFIFYKKTRGNVFYACYGLDLYQVKHIMMICLLRRYHMITYYYRNTLGLWSTDQLITRQISLSVSPISKHVIHTHNLDKVTFNYEIYLTAKMTY